MRPSITRLLLVAGLLALLAACGTSPSATAPTPNSAAETPPTASTLPPAATMGDMDHSDMSTAETATPDGMAGMDHGDMPQTPAGDLPYDAQFIDGMIVHHQGAIAMAKEVLAQPEVRPELTALAEAIIAAQEAEIVQMTQWRGEWYPDLPPTTGTGMDMGDMEISDDASIPFEQRFITAMIDHHRGAIAMARDAQTKAEHAEIKTLAQSIITAQEAEIAQMTQWQQEWFQ